MQWSVQFHEFFLLGTSSWANYVKINEINRETVNAFLLNYFVTKKQQQQFMATQALHEKKNERKTKQLTTDNFHEMNYVQHPGGEGRCSSKQYAHMHTRVCIFVCTWGYITANGDCERLLLTVIIIFMLTCDEQTKVLPSKQKWADMWADACSSVSGDVGVVECSGRDRTNKLKALKTAKGQTSCYARYLRNSNCMHACACACACVGVFERVATCTLAFMQMLLCMHSRHNPQWLIEFWPLNVRLSLASRCTFAASLLYSGGTCVSSSVCVCVGLFVVQPFALLQLKLIK